MSGALHVIECDLIRLRTREGMKGAKAKGRLRGKQPTINRRQEIHLVSLAHSGEYSTLEIAEFFGVGRSTGWCGRSAGFRLKARRDLGVISRAVPGAAGWWRRLRGLAALPHLGSRTPAHPPRAADPRDQHRRSNHMTFRSTIG